MKKRLKGLVALVMAVAMVMPVTTYAVAAIDDVSYEAMGSTYSYMEVINSVNRPIEERSDTSYKCGEAEVGTEMAELVSDYTVYNWHRSLYDLSGWRIWGRTPEGGYDSNNVKEVEYDYVVTAEDIKAFGYVEFDEEGEVVNYYPPAIQTIYSSEQFTISVCDTDNEPTSAIIIDTDSLDNKLNIPEGYIGYLLYAQTEGEEPDVETAFVADYEDIWTEIEIMTCFGFTPVKIVPTKTMPYYISYYEEDYFYGGYYDTNCVVNLKPEEVIFDNEEVQKLYEHFEYDKENTDWYVWRVNYCGSASDIYLDNDGGFDKITKALSVEEYTDARKDIYMFGYSDTYYYQSNYPAISAKMSPKDYSISYYKMDGTLGEVFDMDVTCLDWASEEDFFESRLCYQDEYVPDAWKFIYDDVDYGVVENGVDIWDIIVTKNDYDYTKAKLIALCENHIADPSSGTIVKEPTTDAKGKTQYKCVKCNENVVVEDIDKLIKLESVTLNNSTFTYTGSAINPGVTVKAYVDSELVALSSNDYTVTFSNNKMPGLGTVKVTGKGLYGGTIEKSFTIKPAKVSGLKATAGVKQITLSWTTVPGATGYYVYGSAEDGEFEYIGSTTSTSFTAKGVPEGIEYDYCVRAYVNTANGKVFGAYSNSVEEAAKITIASVKLGKTSYVYTGKTIKPSVTVKAAGKTLKEGTDYTVSYSNNTKIGTAKVTVKGKGNYTGTITANFLIKPDKVTGLKQSGYYTNKIRLRWNATKGATGYIVYRVNTKTGKLKYIGSTKTTAFESKSLKSGTDYKYAVKAYTNVGKNKVYGSRSVIKTMMTETAATSVRVTSTVKRKAVITWNKVTGADGYEVFMASSRNGSYKKITTLSKNASRYTKNLLTSRKTYYFKVRSYKYNAGGAKVYSAYSTIKPVKVR